MTTDARTARVNGRTGPRECHTARLRPLMKARPSRRSAEPVPRVRRVELTGYP